MSQNVAEVQWTNKYDGNHPPLSKQAGFLNSLTMHCNTVVEFALLVGTYTVVPEVEIGKGSKIKKQRIELKQNCFIIWFIMH